MKIVDGFKAGFGGIIGVWLGLFAIAYVSEVLNPEDDTEKKGEEGEA